MLIAQPYINDRGGYGIVMLKIAQRYDAKILTLEYDKAASFPEFADLDIEIIGKHVPLSERLPYRASQGLRYGYNFYNLKITEDYDVINAHISPSEWIRHKNRRVLWYCHTPPREVYDLYAVRMKGRSYRDKLLYSTLTHTYKFVASGIVKKLEAIAVNSVNTQARLRKYMGAESKVINPGLDPDDFRNEGDGKYFYYPSRIVLNKRQEYVINAFRQFVKKTGKSNYRLVIAGNLSKDKEHQEYFAKLKALAKEVKGIEFRTNVSNRELYSLYANCTAVLFAAINEDYGYVPIQAMASGKPIISVNEGGPRETIVEGKTGVLVNSFNEMAEAMARVVEDKGLAERMGKAGRKRVMENYTWDAFFRKFDPIVKKVSRANGEHDKE